MGSATPLDVWAVALIPRSGIESLVVPSAALSVADLEPSAILATRAAMNARMPSSLERIAMLATDTPDAVFWSALEARRWNAVAPLAICVVGIAVSNSMILKKMLQALLCD